MTELCTSCQELKDVEAEDLVGRQYCAECVVELRDTAPSFYLQYLANTIPFHVGDRVECRTAGQLFDGVGVVQEVSTELEKFGTPIHPSFHVILDEKAYPEAPDECWYMERCLTKVAGD